MSFMIYIQLISGILTFET